MTYEKLRLGHSPLTDRIFLGKLSKDGMSWSGDKKDVTNNFIGCVISRWNGYVQTITASDGRVYEISVKEIKEQEQERKTENH